MRGLNWLKDAEKSFENTHRRHEKCTIKTKLDTNEILVQKLFAKTLQEPRMIKSSTSKQNIWNLEYENFAAIELALPQYILIAFYIFNCKTCQSDYK